MFQSTRPAWGATRRAAIACDPCDVSIHAPRVGRDMPYDTRCIASVSIHAPRVGRDTGIGAASRRLAVFQSTRPAWGATSRSPCRASYGACFNPRAPRGARRRDLRRYVALDVAAVSIHAPRVGRDGVVPRPLLDRVSIHAPRVGRDDVRARNTSGVGFNPRAPRGARRCERDRRRSRRLFQSTRPAWGATAPSRSSSVRASVSIHAPRVGRDPAGPSCGSDVRTFQSTRPAWGATRGDAAPTTWHVFQSTRPAWGATRRGSRFRIAAVRVSIHAPRVGRDRG